MTAAVYLTGLGVAAPNGLGAAPYWAATLSGRSGISEITRFDASGYPARLAGQLRDFDPEQWLPGRLRVQTDVSTQLALVAADWALADAGASEYDEYDRGVVTANALGGFEFTHRELRNLYREGPRAVGVYEAFAWFYALNTGQISIRAGLRGPNCALVAEQAGGLDAIGHARRTVRNGTSLVLAGGVDSALDPWGWVSQLTDGRVSRDPDPDRAYRPFDRDACGYLPGEGGAFCVLEDAEAALAIRDGVIPATATTRAVPPDYDLDLVTGQSRPGPVTTALVLARGKWGFNSAVVLRAVRAESPAESTAP